jgi:uncharacterized membrane protein YfcA
LLIEPRPDRTELRIRFVAGFLFGFVAGGLTAPQLTRSTSVAVAAVAATSLICAFLSRRYGDRFWFALRRL